MRFETYEKETKQTSEYFDNEVSLEEINADAPIGDVWQSIKEIVCEGD